MAGAVAGKSDGWIGAGITVVMLLLALSGLLQGLERKAYDWGVQAAIRAPSERIAVIAIDDQSIANLGRWPWSRELHARMVDLLAGAGAKVIGYTVFFSEPQRDPGYGYILKLSELVEQASLAGQAGGDLARIGDILKEAEQALNTDRRLAASYGRAGNVLLPVLFELGDAHGRPDQPLPDYVSRNRLSQVHPGGDALPARALQLPLAALGSQARGLGHLNATPDGDGGVRSEALVVRYYDQYFPSLALMLAAQGLNLGPADVVVRLGEEVRVGKLRIPTDGATRMHTFFYKGREERPAFVVDSFFDVLSGKIPASKYAGKIVLLGATAAGVGTTQVTPVSPAMAPVLTLAHSVSSIMQEHFFVVPAWGQWLSLGAMLLVGAYLALGLPRLSAAFGALATGGLLLLIIAAHFGLLLGAGLWVQWMGAAVLLLAGHLLLTTRRFFATERGKERSDLESAESNRMLGLAFQGQGQLDMAFDKFRKCPVDDHLLENLYNLALDYERKRQFNKAEAVFRYMAEHRPDFRDLPQRLKLAQQMSETVLLGGARSAAAGGTLIVAGGQVEKPMLGRYQVEKELGKGAMGVVYLGRDPKINRVVAIKTMALSQEFDEDELADVKARFFREAETAGRLTHPNIVTMYDAGEEHDLAYIAMEFLKGRDLVPCAKPGGLLPLPRVLSIVQRVAEALDYAHGNGVVHRDIKPANIMYEPDEDVVKVTDFGIARITDASRTKTGMVLGTPSYMSPEQIAGKKIDGRSDLFSLGVTLYQLCCGQLPFSGDSLAQLMYRIANEHHPDIRTVNPQIPGAVVAVINRALHKDLAQRYQRGGQMANDLKACQALLAKGK
ncbi:serine/threonine-protein kinase [Dechloromonas sp. ZY10]|uniref:CHASE2 domain-containing serine/threonine-protein kinase n=1 Tax=Dechloromonas aquae TaxID=2664436 RepID=UPI003526F713